MDHVYPPGPATVPPNLTAATAAYKHRAWLAMGGLAAFIVLYFALSGWFAWTAWRLFDGMFGQGGSFDLFQFVAAVCAAFLAVFMLKALFFIQHRFDVEDIEITRQDQPQLFEFIDRLADEARAPRAHKVYLSARVNAAVFYDLSLLNLIIPSKKNLEIGLGLVNVVTLGELKAVLAHEFGHFAQRSMAVGRWVYISQQIAGHIVARRDALDKLLAQLSRFDLRIAWVGWILSIIVWSIRSMMDVLFRGVLLAQRALSRQMEFQADLVAVSLTGSDALIHALHKLSAADDAWDKALAFANSECGARRGITDLFAVQTRIIERMRGTPLEPYASLARGNLEAAMRQAKEAGDGRVVRLVASSDGALRSMMDAALALPLDDSADLPSAFAMYAIAVRTQRDPAPYSAHLEKLIGGEGKSVMAFLEAIRRGDDPAHAEAALPLLGLQMRMHALHAAVIILGRGAPAEWRTDASRGLFVGERGYMARL